MSRPWRTLFKTTFWHATALVLYLALSPAKGLPSTGWDKFNHVLAFGTLGALAVLAWPARLTRSLVLLVGYGILIEVLQAFTPTRSPELLDVLADSADCNSSPLSGRRASPSQEHRDGKNPAGESAARSMSGRNASPV